LVIYQLKKDSLKIGLISISLNNGNSIQFNILLASVVIVVVLNVETRKTYFIQVIKNQNSRIMKIIPKSKSSQNFHFKSTL